MRSTILTAAVSAVLLAGVFSVIHSNTTSAQQKEASRKLLRHVVLFKFKEGTSKEQVKQIEDAFRDLPSKIDAIRDFEWGTDVSPEGKSKGFTHCFFVTFADEKGRDAYLPHAAHKDFVKIVGPHVEDVCVVDYWTQK
jgi:hypothetical protein